MVLLIIFVEGNRTCPWWAVIIIIVVTTNVFFVVSFILFCNLQYLLQVIVP